MVLTDFKLILISLFPLGFIANIDMIIILTVFMFSFKQGKNFVLRLCTLQALYTLKIPS